MLKDAAMEDVPITLDKEESARGTGQDAAMEDVPITLSKEESALDTGQMLKDAAMEDV